MHLEYKSNGSRSKAVHVLDLGEILSVDEHLARSGTVKRAEHVQQRGLAAPRGSHDGQHLALSDGEIDVVKSADLDSVTVGLGQVLRADEHTALAHGIYSVSMSAKAVMPQRKRGASSSKVIITL